MYRNSLLNYFKTDDKMKIALLGDIAFFGKHDLTKNPSAKEYFAKVAEYLKGFDVVVGNFETPFSIKSKPYGSKSAYIKTDPVNVELLKFLNIGVVNLANNHIFDFGREGYELTKKILNENGIKYFGIEDKTEFIEFAENKIGLHGYCCYSTNPVGIFENKNYGINKLDVKDVTNKLQEYYHSGYLNIVSVHAGQEHVNYPNYDHIRMARQLSETAPFIYYGHHPHVLQGIEKINKSLIAYSLGNFCFDDVYTTKSDKPLIKQTENNRTSIILSIEIKNSKLINFETIGIYADDYELLLNHDQSKKELIEYSEKLSLPADEYIPRRRKLINTFIERRKALRDLRWYLKRLNLNSAFMIAASKKNIQLYKKHLLNQLKR